MRKYRNKSLNNNVYHANKIDILIRAANLADMPKELMFSKEPTIIEDFGLMIRMIRKKNKLDIQDLALKSNCSPEIIIALEMGILSIKEIGLYLPGILCGFGLNQSYIVELMKSIKAGK